MHSLGSIGRRCQWLDPTFSQRCMEVVEHVHPHSAWIGEELWQWADDDKAVESNANPAG